jgi:hypothetical protein
VTPWNVSHLTPLRAVRIEPDLFQFEWPAESPKAVTEGDDYDLRRLQLRNAKLRRLPFPVIDPQEAS